ncbi:MAG: hypothetical protein IJ859_06395 [Synergistaceae bacterium]|nr:hypothetical protein [Synergistaceae bacterium]
MGLFKCRYCGKVLSDNFMSMKRNLCRKCYIDLEEIYDKSGIHKYIRDHGLPDDFTPEQLAKELGVDTRSVVLLYELGFFERDIQVYNQSGKERRQKLADELSLELNKMRIKKTLIQTREPEVKPSPKHTSYGGGLYRRRTR